MRQSDHSHKATSVTVVVLKDIYDYGSLAPDSPAFDNNFIAQIIFLIATL